MVIIKNNETKKYLTLQTAVPIYTSCYIYLHV